MYEHMYSILGGNITDLQSGLIGHCRWSIDGFLCLTKKSNEPYAIVARIILILELHVAFSP